MQERDLLARSDEQQSVGLGGGADDLRQQLRRGDPDRQRQADLLANRGAQPCRDLKRRTGDLLQATNVEEGLVDRQAFDNRRGFVEEREHGAACLDVGLKARCDDDRLRT